MTPVPFELAPVAGWWASVAFLALAAFGGVVARRRHGRLRTAGALWAIASLVAAVALANPVRTHTSDRHATDDAHPPRVHVLLDRSDSMRRATNAAESPAALAERWAQTLRYAIETGTAQAAPELQAFADTTTPARPITHTMPAGTENLRTDATNLHAAASAAIEALSARPANVAAHLVLLTDGADTSGADLDTLIPLARRAGVALHAPAFGPASAHTSDAPTLRLAAVAEPDTVLAGDPVRVRVALALHAGASTTGTRWAELRILARDHDGSHQLVHAERLELRRLDAHWSLRHEFRITPPTDTAELLVEASTAQAGRDTGELGAHTAEAPVPLRVRPAPAEVLVVTLGPSWDVAFARRAWRADRGFRVTHLALADPASARPAAARDAIDGHAPERPDVRALLTPRRLAAYELVVLAPGVRDILKNPEASAPHGIDAAHLDALRQAAERAPGLIVFDAIPEQDATPARLRMTETGTALLGDTPSIATRPSPTIHVRSAAYNDPATLRIAEAVTAQAGTHAAITATLTRGRREVTIPAHGLWSVWRDAAPEDNPWVRVARFAAFGDPIPPEPALELVAEPSLLAPGDRVRLRAIGAVGSPITLEHTPPIGIQRAHEFHATSSPNARETHAAERVLRKPGRHVFTLRNDGRTARVSVIVAVSSLEDLESGPRARTLERLAGATGGVLFEPRTPASEWLATLQTEHTSAATRRSPWIDPRLAVGVIALLYLLAWRTASEPAR